MKSVPLYYLFFFLTLGAFAQQRLDKISQSVKVNDNVTINLNTNHTNIIIDTWNKDIVEVEAFMESNTLSKADLEPYLQAWKVNVEGSKDQLTINSNASGQSWDKNLALFDMQSVEALQELEIELADLPVMPLVDGLMESFNFSDMPKMPKMPKLPDLPEGMNRIDFDFERYKEEGEAYMDRWSREYEKKYGEAYAKKMEAWAKQVDSEALAKYEKEMEAWGERFGNEFGEKFGKDMEAWGEQFGERFGKSMEKWGEEFGKDMEKWGEELGKQMEERAKEWEEKAKVYEEREMERAARDKVREDRAMAKEKAYRALLEAESGKNQSIKKTLKIKIPKDAKLKVNVRHGELKFANVIHNLKADLSHATFLANSIDGEKTSINASYTSLLVKNWNSGELKLNFVQDAMLQNVKGLMLNAKSSNINIDMLSGNSIINGSFGDLVIHNISDDFNNLNITLENSNAAVKLPKTDFKLQYQGSYSQLEHPENPNGKAVSTFNLGRISYNKTIVINAKYSKVVMQ